MLADGLLYVAFIMFTYALCNPNLSKTFIMTVGWTLPKAFPASNEMNTCFFFPFQFVYMVDYIDSLSHVEPFLHLGEAYLIMVDIFSDVFLDSVCQYFID